MSLRRRPLRLRRHLFLFSQLSHNNNNNNNKLSRPSLFWRLLLLLSRLVATSCNNRRSIHLQPNSHSNSKHSHIFSKFSFNNNNNNNSNLYKLFNKIDLSQPTMLLREEQTLLSRHATRLLLASVAAVAAVRLRPYSTTWQIVAHSAHHLPPHHS